MILQAVPQLQDAEVQATAGGREHVGVQCCPPEASASQIGEELQSPELAAFLRRIVPW